MSKPEASQNGAAKAPKRSRHEPSAEGAGRPKKKSKVTEGSSGSKSTVQNGEVPTPQQNAPKVLVILEHAGLLLGQVGSKRDVLLCHQEHANYLKVVRKDPAVYRPDIIHQTLLALFDSPLAKAGCVFRLHPHLVIIYPMPKLFSKQYFGIRLLLLKP